MIGGTPRAAAAAAAAADGSSSSSGPHPPPPPPSAAWHEQQQPMYDEEYAPIFRALPPVDYAFAYGSGVFKQAGDGYDNAAASSSAQTSTSSRDYSRLPMLDLVVAVTSPTGWHRENLERNPGHYSVLRFLGAEALGKIQEDYGAALYYNTAVPVPGQKGRVMKYGVISTHALRRDLLDWTWIYAAGRMQKPTRVLRPYEPLDEPQRANLLSAARAALLALPETFSDFQLFAAIAGLSYRGDIRVAFGAEHPRKVANIVTGNLPHFHRLYGPEVLAALPSLVATGPDRSRFSQDMHPATRAGLIEQLPLAVQRHLAARKPAGRSWAEVPPARAAKLVKSAIHQIVFRSSLSQGAKGVFTAGVWKAFVYAMRKMDKYRQGLRSTNGGGGGASLR